jgi:hypothetical protein
MKEEKTQNISTFLAIYRRNSSLKIGNLEKKFKIW